MNKNPGLLCSRVCGTPAAPKRRQGNHEHNKLRFSFKSLSGWFPGRDLLLLEIKHKKYNLYIYRKTKQNEQYARRNDSSQYAKKHLHICQTCQKLTLPPVGESAILVKHEKMRTGLSAQPGKAKKITIRCLVLRRAVVGALPDKRGKHK